VFLTAQNQPGYVGYVGYVVEPSSQEGKMKAVNIADLKNNLSKYMLAVKQGEEILVKDRNRPVAKIVPLSHTDDQEAELLALAAEGKIRLPGGDVAEIDEILKVRLPRVKADALRLLREERDGR
jgi:prevent-host-death family protein